MTHNNNNKFIEYLLKYCNKFLQAHHNDIEQYKAYFERLQNFMNSDLNSSNNKWHEEKGSEQRIKLRTKDLQDDFDEIKSNDDIDISLTVSKSSITSTEDNNVKLEKNEPPNQT